jgi:fructose-1,6-bisphosphatase/inositol monophosphatase family enzyme
MRNEEQSIDVDALVEEVRAAGRVGLDRFMRVRGERKPDKTWVTEADVAVEEFLVDALVRIVPGSSVLGEEGGWRSRGERKDLVWAVDPIDGTADYLRGLPGWCVSAALFDAGVAVAGVVHMPVTGDSYVYDRGVASWCGRGVGVLPDEALDEESLLLAPNGAPHRYRIAHPGKTQCVGSSAAHILYVARGAAACAVVDPLYIWDLGVAVPFLRAVGGEACYLSGAPVALDVLLDGRITPEPVVFAPVQLLEQTRGMIIETMNDER